MSSGAVFLSFFEGIFYQALVAAGLRMESRSDGFTTPPQFTRPRDITQYSQRVEWHLCATHTEHQRPAKHPLAPFSTLHNSPVCHFFHVPISLITPWPGATPDVPSIRERRKANESSGNQRRGVLPVEQYAVFRYPFSIYSTWRAGSSSPGSRSSGAQGSRSPLGWPHRVFVTERCW